MRYPRGVTSFIPAYQPYQPDFTMMGKMLSIKQNQYDQNWKKLNDVYGSLLYADTTHEQSQVIKDQLKNEIDFNLRRVSGLDLSLEQNVAAAQQVFQPFYENANLMYDMAATKNINSAKAKAESYKNSADPDMSSLYWNEGMDEINYRIQEFKEMPYEQITSSGLAQVNYTPHYNLPKEALALMEDIGPKKFYSQSADGKYDIITTNGSQITEYLQKYFESSLGEDPRFQAMFKTEAYVNRKNYMNSNAGRFGGDKLAAEREYLEDTYKLLAQNTITNKNKSKQNADAIKGQIDIMTNPNAEFVDGEDKIIQQLLDQGAISQQDLNKATKEAEMVTPQDNQGQPNPFENVDILRRKVDYLTASALMKQKIGEQAQLLAYKDFEQKTTLNEEYKIRLENELAIQRDMMKDRVAKGTHTYKTDANGNATGELEEVKSANQFTRVQDMDVTADKTDVRSLISMTQQGNFDAISGYLTEGLNLVESLGIDQIAGGQEDILRMLGADQESSKIKSTAELRQAIESYDNYKNSGLNYTYLHQVSENIRKIIFGEPVEGKIDYSKLLDKKFGVKTAERQAINDWHNRSMQNADNINESIANKNYLKRKTRSIIQKGQTMPKTELFAAQFAVDANGNGVGEAQYRKNVEKYLGDTYISEYLKRQNIDAETERNIRNNASKAWDKYRWYQPQLYYKSVAGYIDAALNIYKLKNTADGWGDYINPFNWGKYELFTEGRMKWDMPDYDDVLEAFDSEFKDSDNFKDAPPSLLGGGTGTSGMSSVATVVEGASYTLPYQEFYGTGKTKVGIVDDIKTMMEAPDKTIYSAFGSSKLAMDEDKNTEAHKEAVEFILRQVINPANNELIGNFDIKIKPGTAFDGTKAAYQILLNQEAINSFIQKADSDGNLTNVGVESANVLKDLYKNGLTIISDQVLLNSDAWEKGSSDAIASTMNYKLQEERIKGVTKPVVTQSYDLGGGFNMTYKYHGDPGKEQMDIITTTKMFDLEHYLSTGETKTNTIYTMGVPPTSLSQARSSFVSGNMADLKLYNAKMIKQVKAAIAALRAQNPNITNAEIYNALKQAYGGAGL